MQHTRFSGSLGGEITGLDLATDIDGGTFERIRKFWLDSIVVVVRDQGHLTPEQLLNFTRNFGEPDQFHLSSFTVPEMPQVMIISNIEKDGKPIGATGGGLWWHTDMMYHKRPAQCTLLLGKEVPSEGADTVFANTVAAYDSLDDETKRRIDPMRVVVTRTKTYEEYYPHRPPLTEEEKAALPDVVQPLVRINPDTGRKALYMGGAEAAWDIVGMPHDEGRALLEELRSVVIEPRFVYAHKWQPGDLIMWDNRSCIHSATPYDTKAHRRLLYRTTVVGEVPVPAAA